MYKLSKVNAREKRIQNRTILENFMPSGGRKRPEFIQEPWLQSYFPDTFIGTK
jgi:hypothetical protein